MVQRKVPKKLGTQADHVKSEKRLVIPQPSSSQPQDVKNSGADLKKKMKKSRSSRRPDFESLRSSPPLRKEIPQPGKPPPVDVPTSAPIQQKQSPIKAQEASPNYMKSTSSFDARKELSQVSARTSQTYSPVSKSPSPKNSNNLKHSSSSGHKAARTLTRTSSLKLVRTLTKTPSFKPARPSAKKCSPVVLCENLDVQRSTCSSTLKDSKSPAYLTLNPGATESEGTSVMKVCPYAYCSLNGHRHTPLPPLKCFLSARRRMLKNQKSIKLGCLSPRRGKPSGDNMKEIDSGQVIFAEKPEIQEPDLDSSPITPLMQEGHTDFFIEIYKKDTGDGTDTIGRSKHDGDDQGMADFSVNNIMPSVRASDETAAENVDRKLVESLSSESPRSEFDFEDNLDQSSDVISTEMDITVIVPKEDQREEVSEEVYPTSLAQEETPPECLTNQRDSEVGSPPNIQLDEPDFEAYDMEWEAGEYSAPCLNDVTIFKSFRIDNFNIHDEPVFKSDGIVSCCFKEVLADEVLQGLFDEESVGSEAWFDDGDSDLDASYQNLESYVSILESNDQSHDQLFLTYDALEELTTTEETDGNTDSEDSLGTESSWPPIEDPIEEPKAISEDKKAVPETNNEITRMDLQLGYDETKCTSNEEGEAFIDHQGDESPQDDYACVLLGNQESNSSQDTAEPDQDETNKDCTTRPNNIEVYQSDAVTESRFSNEVFDGSLLPKNKDSVTVPNCVEQELPSADARDGMEEKEQVDAANFPIGVQTSDLLHGFSEADQDMTSEDNDESQVGAIAEEIELNQTFADECLPAETQEHSIVKQSQSNNFVENQDHSEKDQDEVDSFKISHSMDPEDQSHSEMKRLRSAENRDQDVDKMEVEYVSTSDAEETCSTPKITSSTATNNLLSHVQNNSNQEMPKTCKNLRGTIRCKRPVEEFKETREFNPRDPNYLPVELDPEAEKIDLRHQMMDERRNAEEWMVDYALRQAVTKLAPARKRKVALLVEAFEKVMPIPKCESHMRHTSATFAHARPVQACS